MELLQSGKSSEVQYFIYSSLKIQRCVILFYWLHIWDTLTNCLQSYFRDYIVLYVYWMYVSAESALNRTLCNGMFYETSYNLTNIIMYIITSLHTIFYGRPNIYFIGLDCYIKNIINDHHICASFFVLH